MQTTTIVKELLPSTAKLTTDEWRIILTLAEYTRFGKSCAEITFAPGELGYAKRNKFQPDYIQFVARTTKNSLASWHIHETTAESLITIARPAPNQAAVELAWEAGWMQYF